MASHYSAVSFHGPVSFNVSVSLGGDLDSDYPEGILHGNTTVDQDTGGEPEGIVEDIRNYGLDSSDDDYATQECTSDEGGEDSANENATSQAIESDWSEIYPDMTTEKGREEIKRRMEEALPGTKVSFAPFPSIGFPRQPIRCNSHANA